MRKCLKCNVEVNSNKRICPLCDELLVGEASNVDSQYPPHNFRVKEKDYYIRFIVFMSILSIIVCALINYLTYQGETGWWVFYVLLANGYLLILVFSTIKSKANSAVRLVNQMLGLSTLVIGIDLISHGGGWSYNYVVPFINITTTLAIIVLLISKKYKFRDYLFYLFVSIMVGFVLLVLHIFNIISVLWPSFATGTLSFASIIGLFLFADRETSDEIRKKFHI